MSKKLFAVLGLCSVLTLILVACGATSAATSSARNQVHMNATNFVQSSITIRKGERITLVDDTLIPHIIANGTWGDQAARRTWRTAGQADADQRLESRHSWPLHHCWDIPFLLYHSPWYEPDRRGAMREERDVLLPS